MIQQEVLEQTDKVQRQKLFGTFKTIHFRLTFDLQAVNDDAVAECVCVCVDMMVQIKM